MGKAKRRKERLGDAYGAPQGAPLTTTATGATTEVIMLSPHNHLLIADHISREDGIDLLEHCKKSGPWERRYIPVDKYKSECKEIVITCFEDYVFACFWPASRSGQAPSQLHSPLTFEPLLWLHGELFGID